MTIILIISITLLICLFIKTHNNTKWIFEKEKELKTRKQQGLF